MLYTVFLFPPFAHLLYVKFTSLLRNLLKDIGAPITSYIGSPQGERLPSVPHRSPSLEPLSQTSLNNQTYGKCSVSTTYSLPAGILKPIYYYF